MMVPVASSEHHWSARAARRPKIRTRSTTPSPGSARRVHGRKANAFAMSRQHNKAGAGALPTSNNEIYRLLTEFNGKLGELTGTMKSLDNKVGDIKQEMSESESASSTYRQGVREELSNMVMRQTHMESDILALKNEVAEQKEITGEVKTLRTKAQGAGTVGRWLLKIGGWLLSAVGGFAAAWTLLTGRPPP